MKNENYKNQMIRHGEMLLIPVDELPGNVEQVYEGQQYIVAHSETGHHHVTVAENPLGITIYRPVGADSADIYMRISSPSKIEHQKTFDKHETKDVAEGLYLCRPKSEYDPFAKVIAQVRD